LRKVRTKAEALARSFQSKRGRSPADGGDPPSAA
jgi:hypothetical protein